MATFDQPLPRSFGAHGRARSGLGRATSAPVRHLDVVMLGALGFIQALGLVMVYSTTRGPTAPYRYGFVTKQAVFVVLGVGAMAAAALIDYRRFRDYALFAYGAVVFLLLVVLTPLGTVANGTQGWFQIGSFQLQPAEFGKLAVIVAVAAVASHFHGEIDLRRLGVLLAMTLVPMGLVLLQGDLGTALVFAVVIPGLLLVAGAQGKHLMLLVLVAVLGATLVVGGGMLKDYQQDRLTGFLHQDKAAVVAGNAQYNLNQAKIAIGSGGAFGKGLFNGTQTRNGLVPEQHTDFIFTAVGEQLGFVGAGALLSLFAVMMWRVWRTSQLARDEFGTLVCIGVLAMLLFQIFENSGMTMGIMPITGIPLPFMSYGGSSTIVNFAAVGLVLNVHMRRFA